MNIELHEYMIAFFYRLHYIHFVPPFKRSIPAIYSFAMKRPVWLSLLLLAVCTLRIECKVDKAADADKLQDEPIPYQGDDEEIKAFRESLAEEVSTEHENAANVYMEKVGQTEDQPSKERDTRKVAKLDIKTHGPLHNLKPLAQPAAIGKRKRLLIKRPHGLKDETGV